MDPIRAVIFDLGGVVLESPLHVIAAYEAEQGLPAGIVNRVVVGAGSQGAWARHERGELDYPSFVAAFERECAGAGAAVSVRELMRRIDESAVPRPQMVRAVDRLGEAGVATAALTNNWHGLEGTHPRHGLRDHFDVFVESAVEGLRKPDPAIYQLVCGRLAVAPSQCVFLDDIGANLKPARAMGMVTIKVGDPDAALADLQAQVGVDLFG